MGDEAELELLLSFDGASLCGSTTPMLPIAQAGDFVQASPAYDHWHRDERDPGRPYKFTTASQLLDDFWSEVRRVMSEKGIPNDL
jgi:hypothetical protein